MSSSQRPSPRFEKFTGPLAFMSDVHGNLPALDAVLEACRARGAGAFFVAGDLVFRGDQPLEVWKRLVSVGARCTRGTSDLALGALKPDALRPTTEAEAEAADHFRWTQKQLGELIIARLRSLPETMRIELKDGSEIVMVHGSPRDPTEPITHDLSDEEVSALLGTDPADVVVCGGSHVPFDREVAGVRIVGVGSVGEAPGERVAHYTLVEPAESGVTVEQLWVNY